MITFLIFLVGLLAGVGGENLYSRVRDREARAAGETGPTGPGKKRRPARIVLSTLGVVVVLGLVALVAGYLYADSQFRKIETVPVGSELAGSPRGTNYLMVGTDNRPGEPGNRSDTMLVLRTGDGPARILSIPRDLLVQIPGRDDGVHRINAAYNDGPASLIRTVQQSVGIPIDRYMEINFVSFGDLVDALGGVTINFENPAFDVKSGLDVKQAGPVELNGEQALAYVRSRTFTEVVNGEERRDPTADLGRVKRQQQFLRAVLAEAGSSRNPFEMAKIGRSLTAGMKIDDDMTLFDALRFAWRMGQLDPQQVELPTDPVGPALELRQPDAAAVIQSYGGA